jgi:histidyl-tRNA synthetase
MSKIIKISDYYNQNNIPDEFISDNLKNLLQLSAINNIKIFTKKKNKLKNTPTIIKECNNMKKIKFYQFTKELNKLSLSDSNIDICLIESKNNEYINNIKNIDKIIKIVNDDTEIKNFNDLLNKVNNNTFIEIYSN